MRKGFTLIEILVVTAIVAIFGATVFPVFSQVREKARQSSCCSNIRQLAQASMAYETDYDAPLRKEWVQNVAEWRLDGSPVPNPRGGGLFPYVTSEKVFVCPDGNWFGLNSCIASSGHEASCEAELAKWGYTRMESKGPSSTLLFSEVGPGYRLVTPSVYGNGYLHHGGVNTAFCDGSAKRVKFAPWSCSNEVLTPWVWSR